QARNCEGESAVPLGVRGGRSKCVIGWDFSRLRLASHQLLFPAERVILKTKFPHALWRVDVPPVNHKAPGHEVARASPIQTLEDIPFGADERGICLAQRVVRILMMVQLWKERLGTRHSLGVGRANDRTLIKQPLVAFPRRR